MRGIVEIPKGGMPDTTDTQGWVQFLKKLNDAIKYQNGVIIAALRLAERDGITIDQALAKIGDDGRAIDQSFLPTVNVGNVSSVQDPEPLSASSDAVSATISISGHTLQTDFGAIAYNPGSISGLSLNTRYYITTDDPDYLGGAVTYVATTSKPNVTSASGTYLVGSIITPISANSVLITAAASANPIEFTTPVSGWITGDVVLLGGLPGDFGSNLNGTSKTITVLSPTTFTVAVNGTTYAAYTTGGSAQRIVDSSLPDYGGGGGGGLP